MHRQRAASALGREKETCQNCGTPLRGEFCHACGQSVHNPIRHASHALEEVVESIWHLDGRVFRTLRDLLLPGRVANRYLAGHRVRYVAPLRLFLVLSVLTFVVAELAMQVAANNSSPEERAVLVREDPGDLEQADAGLLKWSGVAWLPGFANHWLREQNLRIRENLPRVRKDPDLLMHAYLSAVPKALFVLVPLFALLLKLAYARRGRLYMEHLVVALYSHAWLCLAVMVISLLSILGTVAKPHVAWVAWGTDSINTLLLWMIPLYLLLMQKLVYREGWRRTLLKFAAFGGLYLVIVSTSAVLLVLLSLARI